MLKKSLERLQRPAKYRYKLSDKTTLTAFTGVVDLSSNTPNQKGPTRAQVAQFGNNFLLSGDPASPLYYRFSFYHIPTDFEYFGIKSNLGHGWTFGNKSFRIVTGYFRLSSDAMESESGAIADADKPKDELQSLLEAYDRKIGDCEDRLDRFLEPYRKSTRSCGLLADYYLG
jgi:hypothetical protein